MKTPICFVLLAAFCAPVWAAVTEQDVAAAREPALGGDANATATLFSLYADADGAVAEWINETLGEVAQAYPGVFLAQLVEYNRGAACTNIVALGPDFVDEYQLQANELTARRAALLSVNDAPLLHARERCVEQLNQAIARSTAAAALMDASD